MKHLRNPADMAFAVEQLCLAEPRFLPIVEKHGIPSLRAAPQGLEGLLIIITEQFLSLQAAAAIWDRLKSTLKTCHPSIVLSCSEADLVALGLSKAKARAFHAAAQFDFNFEGMNEHDISKRLQTIYGVGPWTADIYLLSVLGCADAWPAGDLALRVAMQDFLHLPARPEIADMTKLAETWRPWRAVAARLLWSHYRGLKGLEQAQ